MATKTVLRAPPRGELAHPEPLPDPPRTPDMQQHIQIVAFDSILQAHFAQRTDVLVCGAGYLRHAAGNRAERLAPDCLVAFGVNPAAIVARNGYVIGEVGKPPDFVLEVASRSTGRRDDSVKRAGYADYGVGEYWRFDHTGGRYHEAALAGDRLVSGGYEPIRINEEPGGLIWGHSPALGLNLCWDEGDLRFYDPVAGAYLLTPAELGAQHAAERAARLIAETRAAAERTARLAAEAELRRLRRLQGE